MPRASNEWTINPATVILPGYRLWRQCPKRRSGAGKVGGVRKNRPPVFRRRHFQDELIVLCVGWYLRYSLSYRDLERDDGRTWSERRSFHHWSLGIRVCSVSETSECGAISALRIGPGEWMKTCARVGGIWTYPHKALDSQGNTIEFMLSPYRDRIAAQDFLQLTLQRVRHLRPRVINVHGHPAYSSVIAELKQTGELSKVCRCRPSPYLNNTIEQDNRFVKKRIVASQWFRSVQGAVNTSRDTKQCT
jgi:IS6 family transposase